MFKLTIFQGNQYFLVTLYYNAFALAPELSEQALGLLTCSEQSSLDIWRSSYSPTFLDPPWFISAQRKKKKKTRAHLPAEFQNKKRELKKKENLEKKKLSFIPMLRKTRSQFEFEWEQRQKGFEARAKKPNRYFHFPPGRSKSDITELPSFFSSFTGKHDIISQEVWRKRGGSHFSIFLNTHFFRFWLFFYKGFRHRKREK